MKKVFLSALAVAGIAAFISPAQAQVIVNSTPSGAAITGAASFANFNSGTSSIAGEVNYPSSAYSPNVLVTVTASTGTPEAANVVLTGLTVAPSTALTVVTPAPTDSFETQAALALKAVTDTVNLNSQVSLIRAWTSGGLN